MNETVYSACRAKIEAVVAEAYAAGYGWTAYKIRETSPDDGESRRIVELRRDDLDARAARPLLIGAPPKDHAEILRNARRWYGAASSALTNLLLAMTPERASGEIEVRVGISADAEAA